MQDVLPHYFWQNTVLRLSAFPRHQVTPSSLLPDAKQVFRIVDLGLLVVVAVLLGGV